MKKIFKIIGICIGVIVLILLIGGLYINFAPAPTYAYHPPRSYPIDMSAAQIAEGKRIAAMMCLHCHKSPDGKLAGALMNDAIQFGTIYSANITQDSTFGIGKYTTAELAYFLRTGMKRNGEYAPAYMPKFPRLSDQDLSAIIAFLKSDDPLVHPSQIPNQKTDLNFLGELVFRRFAEPLPYPDHKISPPDTNNKVAFGKYLMTAKFDCYSCHSASFKGVDPLIPENSVGYMAGGNHLLRKNGEEVLTPNLTMDSETGLGKWTEQDFITAVKTGKRPFGELATAYPMTPFYLLTNKECGAMWAYLNTLKPVHNPGLIAKK